ncbi:MULTISPECIES: nucleotidyltransferase domain-containing protein [Clostridium]|uniref:nucleotidyltransferase domain-containing protein n=1 Tax=Clostridium TaxID=1485 RepID=UPI001897606E|nr:MULTISPECIES: nucleotidyltransferase domain-containing protein [Clostridium]MCR1950666.1 nucleotidyltransferase domain-containing protein [Clostridium sp. DSM 100503]MDI9217129.1 nucleotidyltransferase domain-containing protein [Clostridium tertium]
MKLLKNLKINKIDNLISLSVFGSYGTKYWRSGDSDIDIFVLMATREDIMDEIDLEEMLLPVLKDYFSYEDIHLTFLSISDYDSRLARQYLDSKDKLIIDEIKEIDFRLYVNKYLRENEWIIRKTREDNKILEDINGSSIL